MADAPHFPADLPDFNALLQQAQRMQEELMRSQSQLAVQRMEASSGGGMVSVVFSGARELLSVKIDPNAIDASDPSLLQDLLVAAINQGLQKVKDLEEAEMRKTASSMGLPHSMP